MRRVTAVAGVVLALGLSACGSSSGSGSGSATTKAEAAATTAAATTVAKGADTSAAGSEGSSSAKVTNLSDAKTKMAADSGLNATQAGCIVDKLVGAVGETKALALVNDDRDLEQMSADDAKTASSAVLGCVSKEDFAKVIADSLYTELQSAGVTKDQASCVGTRLIDIITPEGLLGGASGIDFENMDPATQGKFFQVFADCLPAEVLGQLGGLAAENGVGSSTSAP